jgi:hypothetical protein
MKREGETMTNHRSKVETVVIAICLLGGETQFVDAEDIAAAANNLAPGRFTWKRYSDQIDMLAVRRCLMAAARPENGTLVTGSMLTGWALTERGAEFAKNHDGYQRGSELLLTGISKEESRFLVWQRKRIQAHPAYRKISEGRNHEVTAKDAESFFLLDHHIPHSEKRERIEQYVRHFGNDPDIGSVLTAMAGIAGQRTVD